MRAVCQRVTHARVRVDGEIIGEIGLGWCVLLGIGHDDDERTAVQLVDRIVGLRAFPDEDGRMARSAADVGAEFLVISQITLHADLSRGRRPSFTQAARPEVAAALFERFVALLRERGFTVATGRFGAMMDVEIHNHGPVTIVLSTDAWG
ncbi:MAG TPA: D-aminoacyl-tRNA deacylase [Chloroflexota bacterium]|nr:D-aminoacyl-tRNA deacylase [Chloroflexota bacterium]